MLQLVMRVSVRKLLPLTDFSEISFLTKPHVTNAGFSFVKQGTIVEVICVGVLKSLLKILHQ